MPGLENKIRSAKLLATGKKLKTSVSPDGVVVDVPTDAPDTISSTVVLQFKGAPEVGATPIIQGSDGSVRLLGSEAELHGGLQYEPGGGKDDHRLLDEPRRLRRGLSVWIVRENFKSLPKLRRSPRADLKLRLATRKFPALRPTPAITRNSVASICPVFWKSARPAKPASP